MARFRLRLKTGAGTAEEEQGRVQETQQQVTLSSLIQRLKAHEFSAPALETQGGSSYICSHKGRWEEKMKRKRCVTNGG